MTQLIPGKRYRWTAEGIFDGSALIVEDACIAADVIRRYGIFEVLPDPLPTTPGSVVLDRNDSLWRLIASGSVTAVPMWHNLNGARLHASTLEQNSPFTVLLDAGAPRD